MGISVSIGRYLHRVVTLLNLNLYSINPLKMVKLRLCKMLSMVYLEESLERCRLILHFPVIKIHYCLCINAPGPLHSKH